MDAVQPILPFMGWIVLAFVGAVGMLMVGAINRYLDSFNAWQLKIEERLDDHGDRIIKLEAK